MRILFLLIFLSFIETSISYKAIVFTFHDTGSHQGSISKLFLRLAKDGYHVTVFDTTSKTIPNYGPNITVIDGRTDFIPRLIYNVSDLVWKSFPDSVSLVRLYNIGDKYLKSLIEQKPEIVSEVLNENYDIVILGDIFSTHGIFFAETLKRTKKIPFILYGTTLQLHYANSALGFGRHYLSRPCPEGDVTRRGRDVFDLSSFWIRFSTFRSAFSEHVALGNVVDYVIPTLQSLVGTHFDFVKFHTESSFFMSEAFDRLGLPLSEVSDYKGVGPHCPTVGKLSSNLEAFVNDPKSKGTIFVAFGSHANWDIAPGYITEAFVEAFSNLTDYRFIFSYNGKIKAFPKHIMILEWSPQKEILNHPKTKIFISHSGLKSTTEAICAAIPIIFMPLYAEQKANSQYLTYFGHAETLDKFSLTSKDIVEAVQRIETNFPERKRKMEKLKRLYLDRIINPMEEASFYVTKVIKANQKNGNKLSFKRVSIEQSWFVFLSFDLFVFVIGFVVIVSK